MFLHLPSMEFSFYCLVDGISVSPIGLISAYFLGHIPGFVEHLTQKWKEFMAVYRRKESSMLATAVMVMLHMRYSEYTGLRTTTLIDGESSMSMFISPLNVEQSIWTEGVMTLEPLVLGERDARTLLRSKGPVYDHTVVLPNLQLVRYCNKCNYLTLIKTGTPMFNDSQKNIIFLTTRICTHSLLNAKERPEFNERFPIGPS